MKKIERITPNTSSAPVGKYSHITKIPKEADLYTFSGQIGTDMEGNLPETMTHQITNTFENMKQVLASQDLTPNDVIKVNIWATEELNWDNEFYPAWDKFFGTEYPSMTVAYITALGLPEIKLEIELWAAKV